MNEVYQKILFIGTIFMTFDNEKSLYDYQIAIQYYIIKQKKECW